MTAIETDEIERVTVLGCGTLGASWAALFLAHGLDVAAYDPAPGFAAAAVRAVEAARTAATSLAGSQ